MTAVTTVFGTVCRDERIFADMVGVPPLQVILGNNLLDDMFEVISRGFSHGYNGRSNAVVQAG